MLTQPTPTTSFIVWGQALYTLKPQHPRGNQPDQHRLLLAVADDKRQYLAWYYYSGDYAIDYVLMAGHNAANFKEIGTFAGAPTHLHTKVPMLVDELAGPILASRSGQWKRPKTSGPGWRRCTIWSSDPSPDPFVIHLHMTLIHDTGSYQFPVNIKKVGSVGIPVSNLGIDADFHERGFLNYIMTEAFRGPHGFIDNWSRLKTFRYNLTHDV